MNPFHIDVHLCHPTSICSAPADTGSMQRKYFDSLYVVVSLSWTQYSHVKNYAFDIFMVRPDMLNGLSSINERFFKKTLHILACSLHRWDTGLGEWRICCQVPCVKVGCVPEAVPIKQQSLSVRNQCLIAVTIVLVQWLTGRAGGRGPVWGKHRWCSRRRWEGQAWAMSGSASRSDTATCAAAGADWSAWCGDGWASGSEHPHPDNTTGRNWESPLALSPLRISALAPSRFSTR